MTVTDNTFTVPRMPRDPAEARDRLRQAALELFAENGFDQTTAAQIAARAGVTERTFFRHFPDKREVLFDGEDTLGKALAAAIGGAPAGRPAMDVLRHAFTGVTELLEGNRKFSEPRQHIIAASPTLTEREVAKHAMLAAGMAAALRRRGVEPLRADLAAQTGLAVLGHALTAWFADPSQSLDHHLDHAFAELQALATP